MQSPRPRSCCVITPIVVLAESPATAPARFETLALGALFTHSGAVVLLAGRMGLEPTRLNAGEELLAFREGPSAHVAVVERGAARFIRVNNFYTLGGSGALVPERNQTMIPLLTHPAPREVFFLGLGTGISAGAGLFSDPDRVTVCELLPDVVDFACDWFGDYTNGLFTDPRATIHHEDGRQAADIVPAGCPAWPAHGRGGPPCVAGRGSLPNWRDRSARPRSHRS